MDPNNLDLAENRRRMLAGELYYSFTPDLTADRTRCKVACGVYNAQNAGGASRRKQVELWKEYVGTPIPYCVPSHKVVRT